MLTPCFQNFNMSCVLVFGLFSVVLPFAFFRPPVKQSLHKIVMKLGGIILCIQLLILTGWSTFAYFAGSQHDIDVTVKVQSRITLAMQEEKPHDPVVPQEENPCSEEKMAAKEKDFFINNQTALRLHEISLYRATLHHLKEEWLRTYIPPVQSPPPEA